MMGGQDRFSSIVLIVSSSLFDPTNRLQGFLLFIASVQSSFQLTLIGAQLVERVVQRLKCQRFKSRLQVSTCQSVLGQDAETKVAPNGSGSALHGSSCPLVYECVCGWVNERQTALGCHDDAGKCYIQEVQSIYHHSALKLELLIGPPTSFHPSINHLNLPDCDCSSVHGDSPSYVT